MQEAVPYKRWEPLRPHGTAAGGGAEAVERLIKENPVIVLGKKGCCMCDVVRKLLLGVGANPPIFEIDEKGEEGNLVNSLVVDRFVNSEEGNGLLQLPLVFVGGKLFGCLDKVVAAHLSGELVPLLRQAGALWL